MDMIQGATNTIVISSDCGHGLQRESEPTKRCSKCGQYKTLSDFNKNKKAKDGLQSECRECHAETMRKYLKKRAEREFGLCEKTTQADSKSRNLSKVYTQADLASFTPRQLMEELKARGYRWDYMLEPQRKVYFDKI